MDTGYLSGIFFRDWKGGGGGGGESKVMHILIVILIFQLVWAKISGETNGFRARGPCNPGKKPG